MWRRIVRQEWSCVNAAIGRKRFGCPYCLGQPAKVSADEVLTLKEVTLGKNLVAHEVIKKGVGAEMELLGTQRGVITKTTGSHYWVELNGLNYRIKLTAA